MSGFPHKEKKYPEQFKLYVPAESRLIVKEAKEIARREGESLSQKFIKFCQDYVRLHGEGNPQTLLKFGTQSKLVQCQHPNCNETAEHQAFTKAKTKILLCNAHLEVMVNKGVVVGHRLLKASKRL